MSRVVSQAGPSQSSFGGKAGFSRRSSRESEFTFDWEHRRSTTSIQLTRWQRIKLFFWNAEQSTVCYRTGSSWAFILTFYPLFVCLILALFYGMVTLMNHIVHSYAQNPIVNKHSLTKEPSYS